MRVLGTGAAWRVGGQFYERRVRLSSPTEKLFGVDDGVDALNAA